MQHLSVEISAQVVRALNWSLTMLKQYEQSSNASSSPKKFLGTQEQVMIDWDFCNRLRFFFL